MLCRLKYICCFLFNLQAQGLFEQEIDQFTFPSKKNISNCSWHHWHPWEKREYIPTFNDIFTALFSTPLFYYKILMYPPHVSLTAQMQSLSMTYERIIVCARRVIESNGWTWSGMILLQHTVRNIGKVETHIIVAKNGDNQFVSV